VYSGSTETVSYEDAEVDKGFYYVEVNSKKEVEINRIRLTSPRRFKILECNFTGYPPRRITEEAIEIVRENDEPGVILIPVLKGTLPAEASRREINVRRIREAAEKALLVRPIVLMREESLPPEVIQSIFESSIKSLKMRAFKYFSEFFSKRYRKEEAEKLAHLAVDLIQPLIKGDEEGVRNLLERILDED